VRAARARACERRPPPLARLTRRPFSTFCPPCAAGEIARAAGRDYCLSCCVCALCCCWHAADRAALARRFGIDDPLEGPAAWVARAARPTARAPFF